MLFKKNNKDPFQRTYIFLINKIMLQLLINFHLQKG